MSKEKSKQLAKCPFCCISLKLVGSKQRGNQHYLHEYNRNCILNGFGFIATDENIEHWNTRKALERIVERLEEASYSTFPTFDEDGYCNDDSEEVILLDTAIEIVREEGGMNE